MMSQKAVTSPLMLQGVNVPDVAARLQLDVGDDQHEVASGRVGAQPG